MILAVIFVFVFALAIFGFVIFVYWKLFEKAGKPGWAAIVPVYNMITLLEIAGKPAWWVVLMFIPFVNFIIFILIMIDLAKAFGKDGAFAVGLVFLSIIFMAILALDNSVVYRGGTIAHAGGNGTLDTDI